MVQIKRVKEGTAPEIWAGGRFTGQGSRPEAGSWGSGCCLRSKETKATESGRRSHSRGWRPGGSSDCLRCRQNPEDSCPAAGERGRREDREGKWRPSSVRRDGGTPVFTPGHRISTAFPHTHTVPSSFFSLFTDL